MIELGISNIAWNRTEDDSAFLLLKKLQVKHLEIAPTRIWEEPEKVSVQESQSYKRKCEDAGLTICAVQSVLFGHPEMMLFESETREATVDYLHRIMTLTASLGAKILVFGSPKNRSVSKIEKSKIQDCARETFYELGNIAAKYGVFFCIEPNPPEYSCDFVTTAREGASLVRNVNSPGFSLHLDSGAMHLAHEDYRLAFQTNHDILRHFHLSAPYLEPVQSSPIKYRQVMLELLNSNYKGIVSIEMRPDPTGQNLIIVEESLKFMQSIISLLGEKTP